MRCNQVDKQTGLIENVIEVDEVPQDDDRYTYRVADVNAKEYQWDGEKFIVKPDIQARIAYEYEQTRKKVWA